jgi:hypothetical protein
MNRRRFFSFLGVCTAVVVTLKTRALQSLQTGRVIASPTRTFAYYPPILYTEGMVAHPNDGNQYILIETKEVLCTNFNLRELGVGDYVDLTESEAQQMGLLWHTGRYKRME